MGITAAVPDLGLEGTTAAAAVGRSVAEEEEQTIVTDVGERTSLLPPLKASLPTFMSEAVSAATDVGLTPAALEEEEGLAGRLDEMDMSAPKTRSTYDLHLFYADGTAHTFNTLGVGAEQTGVVSDLFVERGGSIEGVSLLLDCCRH